MYFADHSPPHFHAVYAEYEIVVGISPITVLAGSAPVRVRSMVLEWATLHQDELSDDWQRCRRAEQPLPIDPLD